MGTVGRILGIAALLTVTLQGQAAEERHKWWQSARVKADVGLSEEQSQDLEAVFQATLPRMRAEKEELDRQERSLSQLMSEARVDETGILQAIDRVEMARASASKTRTLMLYRMYRVLTPEQREKLRAVHERLRREHSNRLGSRPH